MGINNRFSKDTPIPPGFTAVAPVVIYDSATQYTEGDADTENVAVITIPKGHFIDGTTFRVTMAGTKTGANAAHSVQLSLGSTAVITIAADDATAVDWMAIMYLRSTGYASQKAHGQLLSDTADPSTDVATATVDTSQEINLYIQMICGNASDEITCEHVVVEMWKV